MYASVAMSTARSSPAVGGLNGLRGCEVPPPAQETTIAADSAAHALHRIPQPSNSNPRALCHRVSAVNDPRAPLLAKLARYLERHPDERIGVDHVIQFVRANPDCFERSCVPGHVTGSAWILSADRRAFLLAHHAKLDRWLQCGGHSDGDPDTAAVALREAREESGLEKLEFAQREIFDVDVHVFPARGSEPA